MKITKELIDEFFMYDPTSGNLYWKHRDIKWFKSPRSFRSWNTQNEGKTAGTLDKHGYILLQILGASYKAHRVVWLLCYGNWPDNVDHINGIKTDNRVNNLRDVSHKENGQNRRLCVKNTSGCNGVRWYEKNKKWKVSIVVDGKHHYLGLYACKEEAIKVRKEAELVWGFHKNHGRNGI